MFGRAFAFVAVLMVAACGSVETSCAPPAGKDVVYIVEQGWHVEIGLPVDELDENLSFYRDVFNGARAIMFGYGKKTFITAPARSLSEYLLGPFPGPAVIQTVGLSVTPAEAYPDASTTTLELPPGGGRALSAYIWDELDKDKSGKPVIVARSTNPAGLFYAAKSEYNLMHTCNTWIADALHAAQLPISADGVVFSYQAMNRVNEEANRQCQLIW